jgi:ribosomal protein S18 acetylase RimI-like enzyme
MPKFDIAHSTRVVETDSGRLVAYMEVSDTLPVRVSLNGRVHPDFEGLGIGTVLNDWGEARAHEALQHVPDDVQVVINCDAMSKYKAAVAFFHQRGFQETRHYLGMAIDFENELPEPNLPEGMIIRPWSELLDQFSLRELVIADQAGFSDHYGYVEEPLDEIIVYWEQAFRTGNHVNPSICFLAVNQVGEIVGLALCEAKSMNMPDRAYVNRLSVVPAWRRQGIALALLQYAFCKFANQGYEGADLHVDADSLTGATGLYKKAGMREFERSIRFEKVIKPGRDIRRK